MAAASLLYNYGRTQRWWGRVLPGMKVLISIVIGLLVVGCEPPKPPDISIHIAAGTGNIKDVKQHLAAGTDVNAKRNNGATPLHEAAAFGHKEITELLIAAGADVDAKDENGYTPLFNAAYWGRKEIVELLIANGADVNAKIEAGEFKGKTPLDRVIIANHSETAELLRKHGGKTSEELKAEGK